MEDNMKIIGESLYNFQSALNQNGSTLKEFIEENYSNKWLSEEMYHVMAIRTTFVNSINQFLVSEKLLNLEKVMLSIITDPLAHDIEYTPEIKYKGHTYLTTHSMIYSKFLACSNPKLKGIYVDSPNIRLEIESPNNIQRGRYVIDFSQMDIEINRNRNISLEDYYNKQSMVIEILNDDMQKIKSLFERMIVRATEEINKKNQDDLKKLEVVIEVPKMPFPSYKKDESIRLYGTKNFEEKLGDETKSQFFWITGLLRENYDLIYPYLLPDNKKIQTFNIKSPNIFNYDILAKSIDAKTGKQTPAKEILSGGIREWLYELIIERIIDNKVLPVRPIIKDGNIENINELGGYGPFLYFASMKNSNGTPIFPDTMGGGIGIERTLYSILRGKKIKKIDDVTFFGKNPDSHPLYLF
ncbi:MAG: hypothetical protein KAT05_00525 [Spirochaetes bacterium]|nr:hypothetical protein [Spirochaetota bacterium]